MAVLVLRGVNDGATLYVFQRYLREDGQWRLEQPIVVPSDDGPPPAPDATALLSRLPELDPPFARNDYEGNFKVSHAGYKVTLLVNGVRQDTKQVSFGRNSGPVMWGLKKGQNEVDLAFELVDAAKAKEVELEIVTKVDDAPKAVLKLSSDAGAKSGRLVRTFQVP